MVHCSPTSRTRSLEITLYSYDCEQNEKVDRKHLQFTLIQIVPLNIFRFTYELKFTFILWYTTNGGYSSFSSHNNNKGKHYSRINHDYLYTTCFQTFLCLYVCKIFSLSVTTQFYQTPPKLLNHVDLGSNFVFFLDIFFFFISSSTSCRTCF